MRLVSLVPSLTRTLCDLGCASSIVGITKFCIDPPSLYRNSVIVGGTKDPDIDLIKSLKPTHIFVNLEENRASDVESLEKISVIYKSFPKGPADLPLMFRELGEILSLPTAEKFANEIEEKILRFRVLDKKRFLYFIWQKPYILAGTDTYISRVLESFGWENACNQSQSRYPTVTSQDLLQCFPEILLLSSEPYPFRKRDVKPLAKIYTEKIPIKKADGKLLSWWGSPFLECFDQMSSYGSQKCYIIRDF